MKIIQSKDYKKPLYAIGIAAALAAVSVTGCGLGTDGHSGNKSKRVDSGLYCKHDADNDDIELAGDVDISSVPDTVETVDNNVILDGGAPIDEG